MVDRGLQTRCHPQPGITGSQHLLHCGSCTSAFANGSKGHAEWDYTRWGLPISQSAMLLTLLAEAWHRR